MGSRLHVCHVSTAGSVELIRWGKKRGIDVTAEATPHHLYFTEDQAKTYDPRYKVNPPLRTREDVDAVREGLADGTIDIVATDHAPHPLESKDTEWQVGAFGMTGLETALPVVIQTMVDTGRFSWADVARVLSISPARIGRLDTQGQPIAAGNPAHIALVDPDVKREITLSNQHSRSTNTPWLGHTLPGAVMYTIYGGRITVEGGKPVDPAQEGNN